MNNITKFVILVIIISGIIISVLPLYSESYSDFYDVYHAEAPFGVLWVETEGSFIFGCGSIDSQLRESYIVKYFDGNKLRSITLNAERFPIIIDGTFKLELKRVRRWNILGISWFDRRWHNDRTVYYVSVRLHIPGIPPQNQTVQWIVVP